MGTGALLTKRRLLHELFKTGETKVILNALKLDSFNPWITCANVCHRGIRFGLWSETIWGTIYDCFCRHCLLLSISKYLKILKCSQLILMGAFFLKINKNTSVICSHSFSQ